MVTKSELVSEVSEDLGLTKDVVGRVFNAIVDRIGDHVAEGEKVQITGFGSFSSRILSPRTVPHVTTGQPIYVAEKVVPSFKAGKTFKEKVAK